VNLEKDQYYEKMNKTLVNIGTTREIILLGDFNGHMGTKVNNQVAGPYGETRINDNGERLIDLCESRNLRITNGYFNPLPVRLKVLLHVLTGCIFSAAFKFTDYTRNRSPLQDKKIHNN
jgi:hypothetical protein